MNTLVLEQNEQEEIVVDVYQKLATDRILFITDTLTDSLATDIIATLLLKDSEDPNEKITLFINSVGGDIRNAFMIYDVMQMIKSDIETFCIGNAMCEAAILLAGGTPGCRFATQHSVISVNQLVNDWSKHTDVSDAARLLEQYKIDNNRLMEILAKSTGKTIKQVKEDFDRQVFFTAAQAVKYGLIDKVVSPNK